MEYTVREIAELMNAWASPAWAESYDNVGLLVGHADTVVDTVVTALDATGPAVDFAIRQGAQMIVTHHPVIFHAPKRITDETADGALLLKLIEHRIAVFSAHTNMDAAPGGTNDIVAEMLGLGRVSPMIVSEAQEDAGMGRIGTLSKPMTVREFAAFAASVLQTRDVRMVSANPESVISRVAICTGKGMSFMEEARAQGAQVYLTGDVGYHDAQTALAEGISIVDAGHFPTEVPVAEAMAQYLLMEDPGLNVFVYEEAENPFETVTAAY